VFLKVLHIYKCIDNKISDTHKSIDEIVEYYHPKLPYINKNKFRLFVIHRFMIVRKDYSYVYSHVRPAQMLGIIDQLESKDKRTFRMINRHLEMSDDLTHYIKDAPHYIKKAVSQYACENKWYNIKKAISQCNSIYFKAFSDVTIACEK
jgi:hypothetical protein